MIFWEGVQVSNTQRAYYFIFDIMASLISKLAFPHFNVLTVKTSFTAQCKMRESLAWCMVCKQKQKQTNLKTKFDRFLALF